MQQVGNFVKGSLLALAALAVIYSPFETEADTPKKVETSQGVVTAAAIVAPTTPLFDSIAFVSQNPALTSATTIPVVEVPAATPTATIAITPTTSLISTKVATASPTIKVLAANIVTATPSPEPEKIVEAPERTSLPIPYDEHFTKYAAAFNVSKETLVHIARCESGFRPEAANGPYLGMFQYMESTWSATRKAMGENPDPALRANPEEAIKTTAWKIAHGGIGSWPVCGR